MSPNGGSDLRKPHVLPVYDQRQQKFIHDERRRNKGVRCDDRLSSIFPLHNIGYKSAGSTDRNCSRMTFTVRASRIAARMLALPVTAIWTTQFWITRRPRYTEFITGELHAQTEARCDAGPRRIYAASHSAVSAGEGLPFATDRDRERAIFYHYVSSTFLSYTVQTIISDTVWSMLCILWIYWLSMNYLQES